MKNYFSDKKIIELVHLNLGYKSNFNNNSKLLLDFKDVRNLMNLAVEVAIGEVVAYKFEYLFEQATVKGELDVWNEAVSRSYPKDMNGNHPVRNVSPLYLIQELDN